MALVAARVAGDARAPPLASPRRARTLRGASPLQSRGMWKDSVHCKPTAGCWYNVKPTQAVAASRASYI